MRERGDDIVLDLSPILRQTVKTQISLDGELSPGIVTKAVHQGVQTGRRPAAGTRVSIAEAARALEVGPNVLQRWRREFREGAGNDFPGNGKQRWSEGRIAELERKVGQQALEIDFLKGRLHADAGD